MPNTELHEITAGLLRVLAAQGRDLAPHLKAALEKLSPEHPSGISRSQLDTPMMRQFVAAKDEVPDALLFFRMGDFFELFGADAIIASDICGLTLTSRDKNSETPVPMAGVPAVSYRASVRKCVQAGFKVAVCDQMEDPRQAKGIVKREIVRIATPAVPGDLEDDAQDSALGCYLAAAVPSKKGWAFACVDVSTGDFRLTGGLDDAGLHQEILTVAPREILVPADRLEGLVQFLRGSFQFIPRASAIEPWVLRSEPHCHEAFNEFFDKRDLNTFGIAHFDMGLQAIASILAYLKNTQRGVLKNIRTVQAYETSRHLLIDDATRRHLDFFETATGERRGSLFHFLNRCVTASGSRALARRINYPFKETEQISRSLEAVSQFLSEPGAHREVSEALRSCADLDRLLARAAQASLDPKGMAWLRQTLCVLPALKNTVSGYAGLQAVAELSRPYFEALEGVRPLADLLLRALDDDPAALLGKGGRVFREGHSAALDEVMALEGNFDALMDALEKKERERTQIGTLKIGYTRVFGYYFEISKGKVAQAPVHFIRKQTLTNGERFITEELKELEEKALSASERRVALERELFEELRLAILGHASDVARVAEWVGELDVLRTLVEIAGAQQWCRPEIVSHSVTALRASVHPILKSLQTAGEPFVANDIALGETTSLPAGHWARTDEDARALLITGPNMAGKSTVMRQLALAQVLFQLGSYVPATDATMGVADRIFTRIGSADFTLKNQSTFMVEMLETAFMLRYATPRSLLLMDEIGRGTSTYDGLSLAWAILEDLHDRVKARTMFSTHYHELQAVTASRSAIVPMQMEVIERVRATESGGKKWEIFFSRRFLRGAAGKSYGLHVAELAGIENGLIARAEQLLASLGARQDAGVAAAIDAAPPPAPAVDTATNGNDAARAWPEELYEVLRIVEQLQPDNLTPREAHQALYALKDALEGDGSARAGASAGRARKIGASRKDALREAVGNSMFE